MNYLPSHDLVLTMFFQSLIVLTQRGKMEWRVLESDGCYMCEPNGCE